MVFRLEKRGAVVFLAPHQNGMLRKFCQWNRPYSEEYLQIALLSIASPGIVDNEDKLNVGIFTPSETSQCSESPEHKFGLSCPHSLLLVSFLTLLQVSSRHLQRQALQARRRLSSSGPLDLKLLANVAKYGRQRHVMQLLSGYDLPTETVVCLL